MTFNLLLMAEASYIKDFDFEAPHNEWDLYDETTTIEDTKVESDHSKTGQDDW